MQGYTRSEMVGARAVSVFEAASLIVTFLPEVDQHGRPIRCHEVARLVSTLCCPLDSNVMDGKMLARDHSWVLLQFSPSVYILDTYAMGRLPVVQLVLPWMGQEQLYVPGPTRDDIRRDVLDYLVDAWHHALEHSPTLRRTYRNVAP